MSLYLKEDRVKKQRQDYYQKNKDRVDEKTKLWVKNNRGRRLAILKKYRLKHKEEINRYGREYSKRYRQCHTDYKKIWRDNNPDKIKNERLKGRFGITLVDFKRILSSQKGRCGICSTKLALNPEKANTSSGCCVDHDHRSSVVRGLLCRRCNSGVGCLNDDVSMLKKALKWVRKKESAVPYNRNTIKNRSKIFPSKQCGICEKPFKNDFDSNLDHSHKTGGIRGLLCPGCNRAIGLLKDSPVLISKSIKWVKRSIA